MICLEERRVFTRQRITQLTEKLRGAEPYAAGKECVYATGSYGRDEASKYSDLDIFVVSREEILEGYSEPRRLLIRLDSICLNAEIIKTSKEMKFPDFSGDGRYLTVHGFREITGNLGKPSDDTSNTFTARLLLLLESQSIIEHDVYKSAIEEVIAAYWRDYEGHSNEFAPAFLINDILRLWRTFCVNYEANTLRQPDEKKAKGKLQNFKLRHSRMLTCNSAILFLLHKFVRSRTVTPADASEMVKFSPTERMEHLLGQEDCSDAHEAIQSVLTSYDSFLNATNVPDKEQIALFADRKKSLELSLKSSEMGDNVARAVRMIGGESSLHRQITV